MDLSTSSKQNKHNYSCLAEVDVSLGSPKGSRLIVEDDALGDQPAQRAKVDALGDQPAQRAKVDALGDKPAQRAKVDVSYDQPARQMNPRGVHSAYHPRRGDLSAKADTLFSSKIRFTSK